jgi:hypothetical protein
MIGALQASILEYTGSGLTYGGTPLVLPGPGAPLLLANSTSAALPPDAGAFTFEVAAGAASRAVCCLGAGRRIYIGPQ